MALVNGRRCHKCGCETKGEEAWVGGQIWCHPCADDATVTDRLFATPDGKKEAL